MLPSFSSLSYIVLVCIPHYIWCCLLYAYYNILGTFIISMCYTRCYTACQYLKECLYCVTHTCKMLALISTFSSFHLISFFQQVMERFNIGLFLRQFRFKVYFSATLVWNSSTPTSFEQWWLILFLYMLNLILMFLIDRWSVLCVFSVQCVIVLPICHAVYKDSAIWYGWLF